MPIDPSTPDPASSKVDQPTPGRRRRSVPPVFSFAAFIPGALGVLLAPPLTVVAYTLFSDRLALPAGVATGLAIAVAILWAAGGGSLGAVLGRRLAFYEISLATLLLVALALGPFLWELPKMEGGVFAVSAWQAQGKLVLVLGLLITCGLAGTTAFAGATVSFLLAGSGRFDPSLSYELFIARSHLRLSPRTLAALFGMVVTGVIPGLLVAMVWSLRQLVAERRALQRGELRPAGRMPATLLMTLISTGGVAIGVWALTVVLSVMSGFEADLKGKILGQNAHGMVLKYGQDDFVEWKGSLQKVRSVSGIIGVTPFLMREVMLSTSSGANQSITGAIVKGVDIATVGQVTTWAKGLEEGKLEWLEHPEQIPEASAARAARRSLGGLTATTGADEAKAPTAPLPAPEKSSRATMPGIVIGRELARSLRIFVGDTLNVISPFGDLGPSGPQPKSRPFRVAAIFYSGMFEYDSKFAYLELQEAQRFFGVGQSITGLELKVDDVDASRTTMRRVLTALEGYPYRVKDWGEMNRNLFSALMMEKVVMAVILGFIVLVASFIIIATLIMLVLEKTKEIAVLKSMGAGVPSIMKIFVAEGVIIGAIGTAFGLMLGYGTCLLVDKVGIPLDPEVYYISNLPVLVEPAQFAMVALAAMVLSYLATIYPATKAARLHPVDGLRSE